MPRPSDAFHQPDPRLPEAVAPDSDRCSPLTPVRLSARGGSLSPLSYPPGVAAVVSSVNVMSPTELVFPATSV